MWGHKANGIEWIQAESTKIVGAGAAMLPTCHQNKSTCDVLYGIPKNQFFTAIRSSYTPHGSIPSFTIKVGYWYNLNSAVTLVTFRLITPCQSF